MTDADFPEEFDLLPNGTLDAIAETMTPNINFEIMIDGATRTAYIYVVNEIDEEQGEIDAREAANQIARIVGVPQDNVLASSFVVVKGL